MEDNTFLTKAIYALDSRLNVIKSFYNDRLTNAIHCKALKECADYFGTYRSHVVQAMIEIYALRAFKRYEGDFYIAFDIEIFKHLHKSRMRESELAQRILMSDESKFDANYLHKKKRFLSNVVQNLNVNVSYAGLSGIVVRYNDNIGIIMINDVFTRVPTEVYFQKKYYPKIKKNDVITFDLVCQKNGLMATNIQNINN